MGADVCCRLHGVEVALLKRPARDADLRRLMGNAMTMSVLEPVLRSALIATGCCTPDVPARWQTGVAQSALVIEAWGIALPEHLVATLPQHVLHHFAGLSPGSLDVPLLASQDDSGRKDESAREDPSTPGGDWIFDSFDEIGRLSN